MRAHVLLTALALHLAACGSDTGTLDVLLRTELAPGTVFARVETQIFDAPPNEGGNPVDSPQSVDVRAADDFTSARRVAQFGPLIARRWAVRVDLVTPSGRVLAARTVEVEVAGTTRATVDVTEDDVIGGGLPCAAEVDGDTVALYTFDDDEGGVALTDATGMHHGTLVDGTVSVVPGPEGCGSALAFPEDGNAYAEIPQDPDFLLEQGAVDFWMRPMSTTPQAIQGVVGRDASGRTDPGHLSVWFAPDRTLVARLQNEDGEAVRCSNEPLELDQWVHVAVNFGAEGFDLLVDGVRATRTQPIVLDPTMDEEIACGGGSLLGIAGNDNPWVLGASSHHSMEGTGDPVDSFFRGGAIDHLRISSIRR